jgi:hypothetical protein
MVDRFGSREIRPVRRMKSSLMSKDEEQDLAKRLYTHVDRLTSCQIC